MTIGSAVAEMYQTVAGGTLKSNDQAALEGMLAEGVDGQWASEVYGPTNLSRAVLDARALAGLFLFHEDILWSTRHAKAATESYRRLRSLIEGADALRSEVLRFSAVNGAQRIETRAGRRLAFAVRPNGGRGLSVDCVIAEEADLDDAALLTPNVVAKPYPQLVLGW